MSVQQMMHTVMEDTAYLPPPDLAVTTSELSKEDTKEVVGFLSERPVHTVIMCGLIRDNGLVSDLNRGTFYGCRNSEGRLEGVALIGHATLIECRTRAAVKEFAKLAQMHDKLHMFMAEQESAERFWNSYADDGQPMRLVCRELLFELKTGLQQSAVEGLRPATLDDLHLIAPVHAAMAAEESGVDPLEADREGFLWRCRRRISQGRVWVVVKDDELVFKADIQAETSEVIYLEGTYVGPAYRGTGIGRRCLTSLCSDLLKRTHAICLLCNEENETAQAFYRMCGFRRIGNYDTIFLSSH